MRLKIQTAAPAPARLLLPQAAPRLRSSTGLEPGPPLRCPCKTKPGACGLGFLFWWAIPISARTQNLTKGDGLGILFEVEVQHNPVLKDIDRVDEVVDDLPLVHRTAHIPLPELLKPEQDLFPAQSRPLQLFFQDAGLEGVPAGFQLVQALLGGGRQDALLDGLQQVGQAFFRIAELLFQNREAGVFSALGFQN